MEKEKVLHVLSVLLDEFAKDAWHNSLMCWDLSGDTDGVLVVTLNVYENYTISQSQLWTLVEKFYKGGIETKATNFRTNNGVLKITINISDN